MFKVESDFIHRGYRCVTVFTDMGHRCGYVGVPEGHPLYEKDTESPLKVTMKDIENQPLGNRGAWNIFRLPEGRNDPVKLGVYFDVHGGITYSGDGRKTNYPVEENNLWWIGFDCAHYGDCPDYETLEMLWPDDKTVQHRLEDKWVIVAEDSVVRTLEYAMQECKNLVDQIIDLVEKYYR